jgi:hypothetical protein
LPGIPGNKVQASYNSRTHLQPIHAVLISAIEQYTVMRSGDPKFVRDRLFGLTAPAISMSERKE